jgi:hypothetical protein
MATINIVFNRIGQTDPITYSLALLGRYIDLDIDVQTWSQQLSFIFVGIMIFSSIRGLLLQLMKASQSGSIYYIYSYLSLVFPCFCKQYLSRKYGTVSGSDYWHVLSQYSLVDAHELTSSLSVGSICLHADHIDLTLLARLSPICFLL